MLVGVRSFPDKYCRKQQLRISNVLSPAHQPKASAAVYTGPLQVRRLVDHSCGASDLWAGQSCLGWNAQVQWLDSCMRTRIICAVMYIVRLLAARRTVYFVGACGSKTFCESRRRVPVMDGILRMFPAVFSVVFYTWSRSRRCERLPSAHTGFLGRARLQSPHRLSQTQCLARGGGVHRESAKQPRKAISSRGG